MERQKNATAEEGRVTRGNSRLLIPTGFGLEDWTEINIPRTLSTPKGTVDSIDSSVAVDYCLVSWCDCSADRCSPPLSLRVPKEPNRTGSPAEPTRVIPRTLSTPKGTVVSRALVQRVTVVWFLCAPARLTRVFLPLSPRAPGRAEQNRRPAETGGDRRDQRRPEDANVDQRRPAETSGDQPTDLQIYIQRPLSIPKRDDHFPG